MRHGEALAEKKGPTSEAMVFDSPRIGYRILLVHAQHIHCYKMAILECDGALLVHAQHIHCYKMAILECGGARGILCDLEMVECSYSTSMSHLSDSISIIRVSSGFCSSKEC